MARAGAQKSIPSLAKLIARNRFLDSIKIYKYGLSTYIVELDLQNFYGAQESIPSLAGRYDKSLLTYRPPRTRICKPFKGSLTRDFRLQVFFINQCPPGSRVSHEDHFEFFRKFAEIFPNECLSAVSTTPAKKRKIWR